MACGDRRALAGFYDQYAPRVYGVIGRIVRDPAEAADVLAAVFWEAWQAAGAYGRRTDPRAWILARAHTRAVERARALRWKSETLARTGEDLRPLTGGVAPRLSPQGELDPGDPLGRLPEPERAAVAWAYWAGLTQSEVAERLERPLDVVRRHLRAGLERLSAPAPTAGGGGDHEPFDTDAPAYALGALDGEALLRFEAHLAEGCGRCRQVLTRLESALATLAAAVPEAAPPREVRADLLARAAAEPPRLAQQRAARRRWARGAFGTAIALLAGALFGGWFVAVRSQARLGSLARELAALRGALAERDPASAEPSLATLLRHPATRLFALRGTVGDIQGRVVWRDGVGGWLFAGPLPPAPQGRVYALWALRAGRPYPGGTLAPSPEGHVAHRVPAVPGPVEAFAVSVEPPTAGPEPTGPVMLSSDPERGADRGILRP
jgi:RNA polymerase sigma-70 factor (ECF subfamily)